MKATRTTCFAAGLSLAVASAMANAAVLSVFINEFHYDNESDDTGEFIEIAGPAGTDLSAYALILYNQGSVYGSQTLSGIIPNEQNGMGTIAFTYPQNGLQNGGRDGFALLHAGIVVQLLSYEGTFVGAMSTPASGMTSTDVMISEGSSTAVGSSLSLQGVGRTYDDFTWVAENDATPGEINMGQRFVTTVPEPGTSALLLAGLGLLGFASRRRQK